MSDVAYTRTKMLAEQEPPASTVGIVGWFHSRLLSGWFNTVLTIFVIAA
ncbi:MAG: general L-amino acid transport system permease protein, partial [Paracoccaceae bacterium]